MKFEIRKDDTTWKLQSVLKILNLYRKSRFYKTLLFCITIYPMVLLLSSKTNIREKKKRIIGNELKKFIKEKYDLKLEYLAGPYALESLLDTFVRENYGFFKITKRDVVYDIGATLGEYGLKCAKEGARVFTFELEKEPYNAIGKHIRLNRFEDQMVSFNCKVDNDKNSIDSFIKKTKKAPTLIKMNLEGNEEEVLKGAKRTLNKYKPRIILATQSPELKKDCINFLKARGYKIVHYKEINHKTKLFFLNHKRSND